MNSGFSDNFMRGAQLVLQAHGIKNQREQQQWMQKLWQSRLETEGLTRERLTRDMENEEILMAQDAMQKERMRKAMQGAFGIEETGGIRSMDIPAPGQEGPWMRNRMTGMLPSLAESGDIDTFTKMAQMLMPKEGQGWKPGSFQEAVDYEKAKQKPSNINTQYFKTPDEAIASIKPPPGYNVTADLTNYGWQPKTVPQPGNIYIGMTPGGGVAVGPSRGTPNVNIVGEGGGLPPILPKTSPQLPAQQLEGISQGINALKQLTVMERNISASGIGTGLLRKGTAALGVDPKAQQFEAAKKQMKLAAQAMIKGIPSNFDVQTVIDTLPDLSSAESNNKIRIELARDITKTILKNAIGYYLYNRVAIPPFMLQQAKALGVDMQNVRPWDGKTDPLQEAIDKSGILSDIGTPQAQRPRFNILEVR